MSRWETTSAKTRQLVFMGLLVAIGTLSSHVMAIPVLGAKAFPVQHAINVTAGVLLGPAQSVLVATAIATLRNLLGTGTPLAFPGSMIGALLAGLAYEFTGYPWAACIGEVVGTGFLGALLSYPVAKWLLGKSVAALAYVVPFTLSSALGALIGLFVVVALLQAGVATARSKIGGKQP
ncbi:MAG: energy coupling factor transporter S component ThiW [Bacillota bacterium]